ncbi:MAG TPA: TonB family protein [Gemmatimonadaceae bacterium]|nr:TonB family protein [Gemmatimonadaceae bacterium]
MFNNLLESKAKRQRTLGGFIFSVTFHAAVITAAAYATLHATQQKEKREEKVEFVEVKKAEPPKPPPIMEAPPPPKGFQVLTAPVNIPDVLPEIDLTKKLTDEADFSGKGVERGLAKGPIVEKVNQEQTYFEFQVEKPVMQAPNSAIPRYPEILKSAGVEGEVLAQFVVDTTGRAEPETFKVFKATHELFATAVRSALPNMRFIPAEVGGKKVKQLVQQPFVFAISR